MTDTIRIKRRAVGGAVGPPATLAAAEVAFNEQDNTLYYGGGNSAGAATSIFSIGGPGAFARLASPTFTGTVTISGTITGAGMVAWSAAPGPIGSTTASTGTFTHVKANTGLDFGSQTAASTTDFSKHIALYGTTFGICVDNNANLQIVCQTGFATQFTVGSSVVGTITATGINSTVVGATTAAAGTFTTLTATSTVSGAGFTTLLTPYALLAGPTFTGVPAAPTATSGTNTTQLATTAFVTTAVAAVSASAVATIADVAPSIVHGRLWFDSVASRLYIGYNDGNTTQWVAVA